MGVKQTALINFYTSLVNKGYRTIDDVPENIKAEVLEKVNKLAQENKEKSSEE
jgi:hypothetical protein